MDDQKTLKHDFDYEPSKSSETPQEVDVWEEKPFKEILENPKLLQKLVESDYFREHGRKLMSQFDEEETDSDAGENKVEVVTHKPTSTLPPKTLELTTRASSVKSEILRPEPEMVKVGLCSILKSMSPLQKLCVLVQLLDVASDFYFWAKGLNDDRVDHLRIWVLTFASIGLILTVLSFVRLRQSFILKHTPYEMMDMQMSLAYLTLLFEDIPQLGLIIFATTKTNKWNDASQISTVFAILGILEKIFRKVLFEMNCLVVEKGVFSGIWKRYCGQTIRLHVARLKSYQDPAYPVYDELNGKIIAYVGRGHVVRLVEKGDDWMQIAAIPNVSNFFQTSVLFDDIVHTGWVKRHQMGWKKNWDFEFIEMDTNYKFVKQTEPMHLLVGMHKDKPSGEKCMKATKWTTALVNAESIHEVVAANGKTYRYGKFKMLPTVGGWTIAGEGYSNKAWSALKNIQSGDDNWTVETPLKRLKDFADGLDEIALVVFKMMQKRVNMIFAFEKLFNLNHLAKQGWRPDNTEIQGNLFSLLTDIKQTDLILKHEPRLDQGTTIFHVEDGSWKILTMAASLATSGERTAKLISEQHDVVCIVLSEREAKATFWSLRASFEATTLEEIQFVLHSI